MCNIEISQDGVIKKTFENVENDFPAFRWLLNNQGQSTDYALKYGGWAVEITDTQTGEVTKWEPYSKN